MGGYGVVAAEPQQLQAELAELRNRQPDRPIVLTGRTYQADVTTILEEIG